MYSLYRLSDHEFESLLSPYGPFSDSPKAHAAPKGFYDINRRQQLPLISLTFADILDDKRLTADTADLVLTVGFQRSSPTERVALVTAFIAARFLPSDRPLRAFRLTSLRLSDLYDWCTPIELAGAYVDILHRASNDNPLTLAHVTELYDIPAFAATDAVVSVLLGAPDAVATDLVSSRLLTPAAVRYLIKRGAPFSYLASIVEVPDYLFTAYLAELDPARTDDAGYLWHQVRTPERFAAVLAAAAHPDAAPLTTDIAWLFSRYLSDAEIAATLPHCGPLLLRRYLTTQERFSLHPPSAAHISQVAALYPEGTLLLGFQDLSKLPRWYVARLFLHLPGLAATWRHQQYDFAKIIARLVDLDNPYVAALLDQPRATLLDLRHAGHALTTS